jgi:NAD(P)-dependent dehydrogenase (short-subunit alcohol dehydrogenase family)
MAGRLEGKKAVITGGNNGLGLATAERFIAEGAEVLLCGRNAERVDKAAAELGPSAAGIRADVTSAEDLKNLAAKAKELYGSVDILFANAGLGQFAPVDTVDEAHYDLQFDINVKGLLFTVVHLLPLMDRGASIVLNASVVNPKGLAGASVYSATKAAVRSFARTMTNDLGPKGIRINCVSPGYVQTDFLAGAGVPDDQHAGFAENMIGMTPLGKLSTAEDIAAAVLFLASDESGNITGVDLPVDGGWVSV